jgi:hypothetical protein
VTTITFKIDGPPGRVPADAFATVLTESLSILKDLHRSLRGAAVTWYVTDLKIDSAVASLSADDETDAAAHVANEYVSGLRIVESGEALPPGFSDSSLTKLKRMVKPLGSKNASHLDVTVGVNGKTESSRSTNKSAANIKQLSAPRTRAFGSITGVLDTISVRKGGRFQVLDPVSRRPVSCQFPVDRKDAVTGALEERVTVSGVVVRNAKGQPVRVEDAEFDVLPESEPLVGLIGIDPDFTGGLSVRDYMDRICS